MGMGKILKQAQKMQQQMGQMQEELARKEYEVAAGGGMVKVVINGEQKILRLEIKKEVVDPDDVETLQDLILAAMNQAVETSQSEMKREMEKITGGLNIPGFSF
ncbi:MAG: YbaB/EbfC family nucleoid-associated protein [Candidatus Auribacterota bacterium]|jgi:DNA-binding YbaB/EbfC family protein|uniref:Nucleoid-associated protein C4541_04845 n=1 Tax=Candidatus Auribacter fodinae TaxID=2093366 RepID=A0A3A4RCP3_9BACT|nr:MAG: YbaB/EbfC family nucleoid-associated protein [Candidatus Auribacter fodinae]